MKKILSVVLLLIISSFLVFYKYGQIPRGLAHDENEIARAAFSLENKTYTPFTTVADGHATAYLYTLLFSFKIFGINQFALRFPSRIFGILNVLFFYLILELIYKNHKEKILTSCFPILISLLLLTSRWLLHFSRVAYEVPFLLFLELTSIYFLFSSMEKGISSLKFRILLLLSGLFAGLAFNSYQPGRIFFLVPIIALIYKKIEWKKISYFLVTFIIVILPLSIYLIKNPGNDIRINQQFFLKNSSLSVQKKAEFLGSNIANTTLMFFTKGDINGHHNYTGKPALNPILGVLLIAGLFIGFLKFRHDFYFLFFIIYFIFSLIPSLFTYPWENPNMLRTYTTLPSIIFFVSLSIIVILNLSRLTRQVQNDNRINLNILPAIIIALLILLSSFYELRTYFYYQPLVFKQAFDVPDYLPIIRQNAQRNDLWSF